MTLDVELYRRTVHLPATKRNGQASRCISVIDIAPEGATHTMVLVHGYGGNALQWVYQLRTFGQFVRVIAPDLRGHGLSDDPHGLPYTMDGLVDDLNYVLDALQVQRPFSLIAHSFGGAIATEYALRHPKDLVGLVLIGVPSRFIVRSLISKLINVPDPIFSIAAKVYGVALFAPQRTLKAMLEQVMSVWRGSERWSQLNVPTLVLLGHRDDVFLREYYEDVSRSILNAQHVVISVSAHLVQLERPDAVNRAIRRFIEATGGTSRPLIASKDTTGASQPTSSIDENRLTGHIHANRFVDKPWLQHYDDGVPEQIPLPRQLLHETLSNAAKVYAHRPALIFFGQKIDYRELDLVSNRFAHALQTLGVNVGDRVAIVLPNVPQCVLAFYGTLKAGAVVVLSSPLSTEEELHHQMRDSGARVLLTLRSYRAEVERVCQDTAIEHVIYTDVREYLPLRQRVLLANREKIIPGDARGNEAVSKENMNVATPQTRSVSWKEHELQLLLRRQRTAPLDSGVTSEHLALLQYTSGTTDTPKGVMLSHGNLMVNLAQKRHWISDARRGREVVLCVLPLSHIYGLTSAMNLAICLAGSLILLPTNRIDQIMKAIKDHHPSIFPGIPAFYLAVANYPKVRSYGVSSIRICVSGSAPLPVEVQEAFEKLTKGHLVEGYGLTEASPVTHSNPLKGERRVGSIGLPLPGTNARIVDPQTEIPLPPGEVGELLIQGPQVMQGYWNMPVETAQVLRSGWLHTGDLARMDEDGFFTIVDRKKDLILSGLYNIYPRDVEEVLYEHPKVLEAAVVSTGSTNSPSIKAFVVLKRGEQATADELLALCRERLDAYKVPKQIEFRHELPKNIVGKVLRRLLIEA